MNAPAPISGNDGTRLLVGSFCATFLKPEMLHLYRQITGLERYRTVVFTHSRENADDFPFEPVVVLRKAQGRFLRRVWQKQLLGEPMRIGDAEADAFVARMEEEGIRLLHVYFGHIAMYLLPLLRRCPWPVVVSFHGADAGVGMDKAAHRKALAEVFDRAALVLVRSASLEQALVGLGCPPKKIKVHRTGIPLDQFPFRARSFPRDGTWHFVQACRLIPKKGIDLTLRAFANFVQTHPRARLTVAGEGPLASSLASAIRKPGLRDRVELPGFLPQAALRELYYSAHAFVHPSRTDQEGNREGVPNSMLEAMATGLPVLATHHGGIPEAVDDAMGGFLVKEEDATGLAKSMTQLTGNPERYLSMGEAASILVRERFEQRAQIARLEVLYDRALEQFRP